MKKTLLFVVFCLYILPAIAGEISGLVYEETSKTPLDYVRVSITPKEGTKIISNTATDGNGIFTLKNIPIGQYTIKFSFLGYEEITLPFQLTSKKPSLNLGKISLHESSNALSEIQVLGQRSMMKLELDKKVFDVSQSAAMAGSAASDILRNIPSIDVDTEGNVSLRNNTNVTIWINGRPSGISSENQAQILEQLPSESIEKVEVITNPSAKYSAEGTAGIINIVLKKDRKMGYYGSVTGSIDTFLGYNLGGNINLNHKKFDAYFNIGYRDRRFIMTKDSERESDGGLMQTHTTGKRYGAGLFARAGFTYHATDKDHIGISGMLMNGSRNNDNDNLYIYPDRDTHNRMRMGTDRGNTNIYNLMLDYQKQFSDNDEFRVSLTYSPNNMPGTNEYHSYAYLNQIQGNLLSSQKQENTSERSEWEAQIDFSKTFSKLARLEVGYKGEYEDRMSTMKTFSGNVPRYDLWNEYRNTEMNHALYAALSGKYNKVSYQAGLRGEYYLLDNYDSRYSSNGTLGDPIRYYNNHFDVFPTVSLTYSYAEGNDFQLNYSRRLNKPRGRQLRPFTDISDSLNVSMGNPNLRPDFSDSFELNYLRSWATTTLSSTLFLKTKKDGIFNIEYIDNGIKYTTYDNIINGLSTGAEFVLKNKIARFIDLTTTVNLYYNKIEGFSYSPNRNPLITTTYPMSESFEWNARLIAGFMLPYGYMLQLMGNYNSPRVTPQGTMSDSYSLDAGIRKSFFNRKLSVSLSGRDLLNSRKWKWNTWGQGYSEVVTSVYGGRMANLTITYNFGINNDIKKRKKQNNGTNEDIMETEGADF